MPSIPGADRSMSGEGMVMGKGKDGEMVVIPAFS